MTSVANRSVKQTRRVAGLFLQREDQPYIADISWQRISGANVSST
jgi:hypothetical protein